MTTTIAIIETDGDHSHVQIIGPLDLSGVQAIELKLLASTASRRKPAIIDMSQVSFLASLGIGLLLQVSRALAADKHPTVVLSPAAEVCAWRDWMPCCIWPIQWKLRSRMRARTRGRSDCP